MVPGAQLQVTDISDSGGWLFLCELLKEGEKNQNKQQSNVLIKGVPHAGWERCSQGSKSPSQNKSITSELRRRKKSMVNLTICKHVFIYLCPYDKCSQEETLLAKFLTLFSASSST